MPAVYDLANRGLLPPSFALVGFARRDYSDRDFAKEVHDAVREHSRTEFREDVWAQLSQGFRFVAGDFTDDTAFDALAATVTALANEQGTGGNTAFYLSIPPSMFPLVVQQLKRSGLASDARGGWRQVVVEKPLGTTCRAPRNSTRFSTTCFRAVRSSGSTTTWARKQCRTCWHCASRIRCSNRSGTATTSIMSRSPWPRTSASEAALGTTTASEPPAT